MSNPMQPETQQAAQRIVAEKAAEINKDRLSAAPYNVTGSVKAELEKLGFIKPEPKRQVPVYTVNFDLKQASIIASGKSNEVSK